METWAEKMKRLYAHIPILPLDELRKLPECDDYDAGVYFLWLKDELQYPLFVQDSCELYGHLAPSRAAKGRP